MSWRSYPRGLVTFSFCAGSRRPIYMTGNRRARRVRGEPLPTCTNVYITTTIHPGRHTLGMDSPCQPRRPRGSSTPRRNGVAASAEGPSMHTAAEVTYLAQVECTIE